MFENLTLSGIELSIDIAIVLGVIGGLWRLFRYSQQKNLKKKKDAIENDLSRKRAALKHSLELQEKIWDFYVARNELQATANNPNYSSQEEFRKALEPVIANTQANIYSILKTLIHFYTYLSIDNPGDLFNNLESELTETIKCLKESSPAVALESGYKNQIDKLLGLQAKIMDLAESNITGEKYQSVVYSKNV